MISNIAKSILALFIIFYIITNCYYWERQQRLNESFVKAHQAAQKAFEVQIKVNNEIVRLLKNGTTSAS